MGIKLIILCLGIALGIVIAIPFHYYSRYKMLVVWMDTLERINAEWEKEIQRAVKRTQDKIEKELNNEHREV